MWRKLPDFRAEKKAQNPVTSLAVMVFSVPMKASSPTEFPTGGTQENTPLIGSGQKFARTFRKRFV